MTARERIASVYTGHNLHCVLQHLTQQCAHLVGILHETCAMYGLKLEKPEWMDKPNIELTTKDALIRFDAYSPFELEVVLSSRSTWARISVVKGARWYCEQKDVEKLVEYVQYQLDVYDQIIEYLERYLEYLQSQVELINQRVEELCEQRLQSQEHLHFIDLLERASIYRALAEH